eukprot:TRINITY_DN30625_c0_g1_i2.p1 TRINITY_DN30625_c0_g1~~TRINITY_DN30625_c0_g1_i2.p1  ORF type:complete len:222 (-),score=23.82 TRINITY_DN30625_c0_g1_i2:127-792(-)
MTTSPLKPGSSIRTTASGNFANLSAWAQRGQDAHDDLDEQTNTLTLLPNTKFRGPELQDHHRLSKQDICSDSDHFSTGVHDSESEEEYVPPERQKALRPCDFTDSEEGSEPEDELDEPCSTPSVVQKTDSISDDSMTSMSSINAPSSASKFVSWLRSSNPFEMTHKDKAVHWARSSTELPVETTGKKHFWPQRFVLRGRQSQLENRLCSSRSAGFSRTVTC